MPSQAYINRHNEVRQRVAGMTFREIVDKICNLEGTVALLEVQKPPPVSYSSSNDKDSMTAGMGRSWAENYD